MARRKADQTAYLGNNTTPAQPRSNSGPASAGIIGSNNDLKNPTPNGKPPAAQDTSLRDHIAGKFNGLKIK